MAFHYYSKLGFDQRLLDSRLALLDLDANDHALVHRLHEIIAEHVEHIIDTFYQKLFLDPEASAIFERGFDRAKLKRTFINYLRELGVRFNTPDYFESRLRVGMAHIWAGVSLSLYQCSYRILQQELIAVLPPRDKQYAELVALVLKLTNLDMSLAIQSYHLAQTTALEEQLVDAKKRMSSLREKQQIDSLTQVFTRETVLSALDMLRESSATKGAYFCVIMADIDHFKLINDEFGHLVGDNVLHGVAQRLRGALRSHDIVGRYGGEEFLLILNHTNIETARIISERILSDISQSPVHADGENIDVTISLGLTQIKTDDSNHSLVERADKALYLAKQNGRNRFEVLL